MKTPKFLIADNSASEDDIYVIHTEYPRFILQVDSEEFEWWDQFEKEEEEELQSQVSELIEQALAFFDAEMDSYESELDEE